MRTLIPKTKGSKIASDYTEALDYKDTQKMTRATASMVGVCVSAYSDQNGTFENINGTRSKAITLI